MRIEYNIFKKVYPLAERMANEEGILIPPSEIVVKDFKKEFSKQIIEYDKMAQEFNKKLERFNYDKKYSHS